MIRNPGLADGTPPLSSSAVTLLSALGVLFLTAVSAYTLVAAVFGLLFLLVGLVRGSSGVFSLGIALLFVAVVVAGLLGMSPLFLLVAGFFTVLAWDVGHTGFGINEEMGRGVSTLRIELVRSASGLVVLSVGAVIGYAVFRTATGEQSLLALVALLVGALALLVALQE
ncbi:hypothetical protein V5735_09725 (plasmid) [Haladaptatus sp. SPP-AMP-3]|uniref:DUF7519 family protein n=1 Tax=Haladaptatus sp. SPP-AMP-3 TaxID=3121295 RepID=UPI003C2B91AA